MFGKFLFFCFSIFLFIATVDAADIQAQQATPPDSYAEIFKPYTSGSTSISTFSPSGVIDGNVKLEGGTLNLQGQTLQINGDLIHSGGILDINGGTLIVTGDYRIQKPSGTGYTYSSGLLRMDNAGDEIQIQGDFITDSSQSHSDYLTAGTMDVQGDFTQLSSAGGSGSMDNFKTSGSHKVILSGSGKQIISFTDVSGTADSHFTNLEVSNVSGLLEFKEMSAQKLTYSENISEPVLLGLHIHRMNFSLHEDMTIAVPAGQVARISGAQLSLNGHRLIIQGSLVQSGGTLDVNGGELIVTGDYRIQKPSGTNYTYSAGFLRMDGAEDQIQVRGSFVTDSYQSHSDYLTAGTMDVQGDFTQLSSAGGSGSMDNFKTSGSHKVILSGSGKQIISFTDVSGVSDSHLSNLDIQNTSGLLELPEMIAINTSYTGQVFKLPSFKVARKSFVLQEDMTIEVPESTAMSLAGSTLDLNGYTLTLKGSLVHSGGTLDINNGKLVVTGDYRIQRSTESGYSYSSGWLRMDNAGDELQVQGDFITDSYQSHSGYLTAGTMDVQGDFTQLSSAGGSGSMDNFKTSGSHKVILSGSGKQIISFTDVSGTNDSHFTTLESKNSAGLEFVSRLTVSTLFKHCGFLYTFTHEASSSFPDYDNDGQKDHVDPYPEDATNTYAACAGETINITGTVKNNDGENLQGINVKFEYLSAGEEKSASSITDQSGAYGIQINKSAFEGVSDVTYLIYAYKEGYHPSTKTLAIGSENDYGIDFIINPVQPNEVILEIEPKVHHLGDDSYGGSANSQFQKKTEGIVFSKDFTINFLQYNGYNQATLRFEAKGIQDYDSQLILNEVTRTLSSSPSDGSYKTYSIELEKSMYRNDSNTIQIVSGNGGGSDYDDFEFANIILEFSGLVDQDSDSDGVPDVDDAFPNDPSEQTDNDVDGVGDNADLDDDNDQMPDTWEEQHGLDKDDASDANIDSDGDGLSNFEEFQNFTNPKSKDSDGDGVEDKAEIEAGTDPNDPTDGGSQKVRALMPILELLLD